MARVSKVRHETLGSIERLEDRQVMSATAMLLPDGVLKVTGTDGNDRVEITKWYSDATTLVVSRGPGRGEILRCNINDVKVIDASMGAGNDFLSIDFGSKGSLRSIKINMGAGANEEARVSNTVVGALDIDAKESVTTAVRITAATITGRAFADFGKGAGNDGLYIGASTLGELKAIMGGGKDIVSLKGTAVKKVDVTLGGGDDNFETNQADIGEGTVDGGAGRDICGPKTRGVSYKKFEVVLR